MKTNVTQAVSRRRWTAAALLSLASFAASINLVFAALVRMGDEFGVPRAAGVNHLALFRGVLHRVFDVRVCLRPLGYRAPLLFGNLMTMCGGLIFASAHGGALFVMGAMVMGMGGGANGGCAGPLHALPGAGALRGRRFAAGYCFGASSAPGDGDPPAARCELAALLHPGCDAGAGQLRVVCDQPLSAERTRERAAGSEAAADPAFNAPEAVSLLRGPGVLRWCVIILLYVLAETALISFVNLYLFEYRGAPEWVAIQAIAWFWAIMLVGGCCAASCPRRWPTAS